MRLFRETTLERFLQHNKPIFWRERATHPLVRNHRSLFSFPLPLSYIEKRFVPKHNPHLFKVQRVFQSLESFGDLPKEISEAWRMRSGGITGSRKLVKTRLREVRWQQELRGLKYIVQTRLGVSFVIRVLQFIHQWIDFDLEGHAEVFHRVLRFPLR